MKNNPYECCEQDIWVLKKLIHGGTVSPFSIQLGGTVPPFITHLGGTVPPLSMDGGCKNSHLKSCKPYLSSFAF